MYFFRHRLIFGLFCLLLLLTAGFWWWRSLSPDSEEPGPIAREGISALEEDYGSVADFSGPPPGRPAFPVLNPPSPESLAAFPHHPEADLLGDPSISPESEVQLIWNLFDVYRQAFGSFPTGAENAHFMFALQGANPGRQPIFPLQHQRLDENGHLLDAWGKPFHFHSISRHSLEIRSAGPDGELFTAEDLVYPVRESEGHHEPPNF